MEARLKCAARWVPAFVLLLASLPAEVLAASFRTPNFVVEAPSPELAEQIGRAAEKYRAELAEHWLGQRLRNWARPCPITAKVAPNLGAGGVTTFYFERGEVFGWQMTVQGSAQRVLDSVLPHEVTHTIFATHFRQPVPRWADEGGCTTVEHDEEREKQRRMLIEFLQTQRGIPFSVMFRLKDYPRDVLPLYAQGHSVSSFLIAQGGPQKFVRYLGSGMRSNDWTAATNEFYGYPGLGALQTAWNEWVARGSPADAFDSQPGGSPTIELASAAAPVHNMPANNAVDGQQFAPPAGQSFAQPVGAPPASYLGSAPPPLTGPSVASNGSPSSAGSPTVALVPRERPQSNLVYHDATGRSSGAEPAYAALPATAPQLTAPYEQQLLPLSSPAAAAAAAPAPQAGSRWTASPADGHSGGSAGPVFHSPAPGASGGIVAAQSGPTPALGTSPRSRGSQAGQPEVDLSRFVDASSPGWHAPGQRPARTGGDPGDGRLPAATASSREIPQNVARQPGVEKSQQIIVEWNDSTPYTPAATTSDARGVNHGDSGRWQGSIRR